LVALADRPLFRITLPSKLQPILACGQPILTYAPGDAARVVREAGAGYVCPPGDPRRLAEVMRQAYETPRDRLHAMGCAGRDYYWSHLSELVNSTRLAALIGRAARHRSPADDACQPMTVGGSDET
jgi:colanic acid biosynthesis glycosyl transferase WcaI